MWFAAELALSDILVVSAVPLPSAVSVAGKKAQLM